MQKKFIEAINEFTKVCRGQAMLNKILEKAWNITRVDSSGTPVAQIECAKLNQQAKKSKKKKKNRIVFQIGLAPNFSATASIKNPEKEKIQKSCSMKSAKDVISR